MSLQERMIKVNVNDTGSNPHLSMEKRMNSSSSTIFNGGSGSASSNTKISQSPHNKNSSINQTYYKISNSVGLENMSINPPTASKIEEKRRKIVIVGDGSVGKTCLLAHYSTGTFLNEYIPTVFQNTHILVQLGKVIYNVALWDTAGQDDYARLRPLSYPNTDAFLLCFAIDQPESFENIQHKWLPELHHYVDLAPIILVGLKSDLRDDPSISNYCVASSEGLGLVERGIVSSYVECSSLTQYNIEKPIESALLFADRQEEKETIKKNKRCRIQ